MTDTTTPAPVANALHSVADVAAKIESTKAWAFVTKHTKLVLIGAGVFAFFVFAHIAATHVEHKYGLLEESFVSTYPYQVPPSQVEVLKEQIGQLNGQIAQLNGKIASLTAQLAACKAGKK